MSSGEDISEAPVVIQPYSGGGSNVHREHQNAAPYIETLACLVSSGLIEPLDAQVGILHQYLEFRAPADEGSRPQALTPDEALGSLANLTVGSQEVELLTPEEARAALKALFP